MASILDRLLNKDEDVPIPLRLGADPKSLVTDHDEFQASMPDDASMPQYSQNPSEILNSKPESSIVEPASANVEPPKEDQSDSDDYDNSSGKKLSAKAPDKSKAQSMADVLFPAGGMNTQENLKAAMSDRDNTQLVNQLGKAAELIGTGFSRAHPVAQGLFDQNIGAANQKLQGFKDLAGNEENDPNSPVSKGYQNFLQKYGVNAPGASAAQIKNVLLPAAFKDQEQKEKLQARHEDMYQQALNRKNNLQVANMAKMQHQDDMEIAQMGNKINPYTASSRSGLGAAAIAKQKVQKLIDIAQDPNATTQDMNLAAGDLNSIVTNSPSIHGSTKQEYNNAASDLIKVKNYLMGTTDPAKADAAKQHIVALSQRMNKLSDDVIMNNLGVNFIAHKHLLQKHPDVKQDFINQVTNMAQQNDSSTSQNSQSPPQTSSGTIPMTKDGVTYKAIPADRVEEAKTHGYR